jgi:predicted nucleic acid-binding protein
MLDDTWAEMIILDLSADLARRAGDLTETLGLRAVDAVQLASALEIEPDDVMLVSWDARLRGAASNAGLPVFPPEP